MSDDLPDRSDISTDRTPTEPAETDPSRNGRSDRSAVSPSPEASPDSGSRSRDDADESKRAQKPSRHETEPGFETDPVDDALDALDFAGNGPSRGQSDRGIRADQRSTVDRTADSAEPAARSDTSRRERNPGVLERSQEFYRWCVETNAALTAATSTRVDVYVRSMLPSPGAKHAQMSVIDDISSLCETGPIDRHEVHVWGEQLCLCDDCRASEAGGAFVDTIREFEDWGADHDATASPFFERTHQESSLVGDAYDGIRPPRVTAALYVDDSLQGVFPSRFAGEPYSVRDFSVGLRAVLSDEEAEDTAPSETKPDGATPE